MASAILHHTSMTISLRVKHEELEKICAAMPHANYRKLNEANSTYDNFYNKKYDYVPVLVKQQTITHAKEDKNDLGYQTAIDGKYI